MSAIAKPSSAPLNELLSDYADVFDAVDSLQEAGLKRELIPKLVVTGDQSSGKSSVLEAICQIPFPVHEDLCTRFPIELIQRKAEKGSIVVTISAFEAKSSSNVLNQFARELVPGDSMGLATVIQEASALILGNSPGSTRYHHFSKDVLRITISGPDKYPLTLVDLPGFFQSPNKNQSEQDKHMVDAIVAPYLRELRNGLLLIIPAHTLWTNLRAPSEVACPAVDPSGGRTLGIFTALDKPSVYDQIINHFSGEESWYPQNGWHGLKNLSSQERKRGDNRDEIEAAFFAKKWPEIDNSCKGIETLRPKLSGFLANQIRRHLGGLIGDVKAEVRSLDAEVEKLGRKKTTEQQQRDYLSKMAGDFRQLCFSAIHGHYSEDFFNDSNDSAQKSQNKRLQSVARALGQQFITVMIEKGKKTELDAADSMDQKTFLRNRFQSRLQEHIHDALAPNLSNERARRSLKGAHRSRKGRSSQQRDEDSESTGTRRDRDPDRDASDSVHADDDTHDDSDCEDDESDHSDNHHDDEDQNGPEELFDHDTVFEGHVEATQQEKPHISITSVLRADTVDMYKSFSLPTKTSFKDFETQVLAMAIQWRGTESLDDVNPAMVSRLYREETSRWEAIASCHLQLVWDAVACFVDLALKDCVDTSLLSFLKRSVINSRLEKLRLSAEAKLKELIRCHQGTNPGFHDFLREFKDESLEFSNRVKPDSFDARKTVLERVDATLSPDMLETILEMACTSIGGDIPSKNLFAKAVLSQVKQIIAGQIPSNDAQSGSASKYHHDTERGAVRRSIIMIEKYYKLSLISFIAYVNALVIHNGLLEKVPDEIFTHMIVSEQSAKTVSYIAGEKEEDTKKRSDCEKKLAILRKALVALEDFRNSD
ncbi:hypothetical protein NW762_007672 [Fusarium torreyae]|uniref:GED domain-containing protein n=1 Tax=Fusarium torreyae TaxID=1237075 RepID=A0A9W8S0Z1_9HYPO|nr:hypothetical protein NW762_007672 [Fusarium torreyae]